MTNPCFTLIGYVVANVTRVPLDTPSAGFAILKSVDGRENDLFLSRTGRILHPAIVEEIFDHAPGVRRHRIIQKADGSLAVMLARKLSELIESYPVEVDLVGEILTKASGKHRWIVSERKNETQSG